MSLIERLRILLRYELERLFITYVLPVAVVLFACFVAILYGTVLVCIYLISGIAPALIATSIMAAYLLVHWLKGEKQ